MANAWEIRHSCLLASFTHRGRGREFILSTDVCVPLDKLDIIIAETEKEFAVYDMPCILCAHVTDGNFHCAIPYKTDTEWRLARELESHMIERAIALGGTISGEHGLGIEKVKHVVLEHGPAHVEVQERIKRALDPDNLMNPGAFYPFQQALYPTAHL
ncbi:D-lactate dehydrogenase (cytochrome) [Trypanosoma grayi]|uniref:D-lactate dehydrogenase (cytochrome) n=1 Tax=Trypanosoma grayi TaxID=71804 RepID=UPI0004F47405|nr:D-lactate dehydrogenase (cytochrome) [Trypanosoma grayi]KEG09939.1 D-lactate dehydrogenase (cytochrome) [Trypanosoma grayi]